MRADIVELFLSDEAQSVDLGSKWANVSIIEKPTRCVENLESVAIGTEGSYCGYD